MTTAAVGRHHPEVTFLNTLLRNELSAVETYAQAIGRLQGHTAEKGLGRIRRNHEAAAVLLSDLIQNLGGNPEQVGQGWEAAAAALARADRADEILGALRQAEEQGAVAYDSFLQAEECPHECRYAIRVRLFQQSHDHIDVLCEMAELHCPGRS